LLRLLLLLLLLNQGNSLSHSARSRGRLGDSTSAVRRLDFNLQSGVHAVSAAGAARAAISKSPHGWRRD